MGEIGTLILIIAIIWIASKLFGGPKADVLSYHEYAGSSFDVEGALTIFEYIQAKQ